MGWRRRTDTTPKPKPATEKQEQAAIVDLLKSIGAAVYVLGHPSPADGRTYRGTGQTPGVPDLYAFLNTVDGSSKGVGLWIEVKRTGGRLSVYQGAFKLDCRVRDIPHVVGGVDAVIDHLEAGGWLTK